MRRIGRHMPTHSNAVKAAEIAQQIGCTAIQIFVSNPRSWQAATDDAINWQGGERFERTSASGRDLSRPYGAFAQAAQDLGLDPVVIHASYLINLASPDEGIWEKSINLLRWTLQRGALLGAKYVIFHTGSHRGSGVEAGVARIAAGIRRILPETPPEVMLLLENDVGGGAALGHSFEHLGAVLDLLAQYRERLGTCLDTAHLWGAGYDISSAAFTRQMLEHFDAVIGLARLWVIHLNDTKVALGSHRDVHMRLGEGIIGEEGLRALLTDARLDHAVVLLETPIMLDANGKEDWEHDKRHFEKAKGLIKR